MESSYFCQSKGRFKLSKSVKNNSNTLTTTVSSRFITSKKVSNTKENHIQCIINGYDDKNKLKYNINFEKLSISNQISYIDDSTRADYSTIKNKSDMDNSKKVITQKLSKLKNSYLTIESQVSINIIPKAKFK